MNEERATKVSFNKSSSGSLTPKIALPAKWCKELNITPDERDITIVKEGTEIIIKKGKNNT